MKGRGGLGVLNIKTTQRNGGVVGLLDVDDDDGIMAITSNGLIIRMSCKGIRPMGRNTQGVRLVSLKKGDHVVSVACVEEDDEKPEDEPETEPTDQPETEPTDEPETEPTDEPEGESEGEPEDEGEQDNDQEE